VEEINAQMLASCNIMWRSALCIIVIDFLSYRTENEKKTTNFAWRSN